MAKRESVFQRFVLLSRNIVKGEAENGLISSDLLLDLKVLIAEADQVGVHGAASLNIVENLNYSRDALPVIDMLK